MELAELLENQEAPRERVGGGWCPLCHLELVEWHQLDSTNRTLTCPTHICLLLPLPLSTRRPEALCLPCSCLKIFPSREFLLQIYLLIFFYPNCPGLRELEEGRGILLRGHFLLNKCILKEEF